jgi:hypothetical protein
MNISFLYGPMSIGKRPIDFSQLWTSERGLTGSELSWLMLAKSMRERGHHVTLAIHGQNGGSLWEDIEVWPLERDESDEPAWSDRYNYGDKTMFRGWAYDAVIAWNEPDLLRDIPSQTVRICNQQLNDFGYCEDDFAAHVDLFTSPSQHHLDFVSGLVEGSTSWAVMPNGCDPGAYGGDKTSGRVVWASSADRGLHNLLMAWPSIRAACPWANLRCMYRMDYDSLRGVEENAGANPTLYEIASRARYIRYALDRLADQGVEHVGSVSRQQVAAELSAAEVLAYPCETVRYTEGFSVTTLESCAAGAIPVLGACDALPSIYGDAAAWVPSPAGEHTATLAAHVVRALTDYAWAAEMRGKGATLAERHAWPKLAERLEALIGEARQEKAARA